MKVERSKRLIFGITNGKNKLGRPHREQVDDIVDQCGASVQEPSYSARDGTISNTADPDNFQNLARTSLSKHTSMINFSCTLWGKKNCTTFFLQ